MELLTTLKVSNLLAEGPLWYQEQQAFWWTDIYGKAVYRYELNSQKLDCWDTPECIGCFGFVAGGSDQLIVASEKGIGFWAVGESQIEFIAQPELDRPTNRFNDGKVDPFGRFWAGAMVEDRTDPTRKAGFYRVDSDKTVTRVLDGYQITNSLCWNADGSTMYHADSPSMQVYQYDFDGQSGTVSNKRLFVETDGLTVPDGAATDTDGGVWVAHWLKDSNAPGGHCSKVVRYAPDGTVSLTLEVPCSQVTSVTFGGPKMNLLMVTSAKVYLSPKQLALQPNAGNVLIYQTEFTGVTIPAFILGS
jgi:sugar lactone lactonase YvrE